MRISIWPLDGGASALRKHGLLCWIATGCVGAIALLSGPPAVGQTARTEKAKPTAKGEARASPLTPCTKSEGPELAAVVAKATEALDAIWLETEDGHFTAYTLAGLKRSPFDLGPQSPDSGPINGFVQARPPSCTIERAEGGRYIVRFTTSLYRFHERNAGWSPPSRDGLMMEVEVSSADGEMNARDLWAMAGLLNREDNAKRPEKVALPRSTRWAEPVPGCKRTERWDGNECLPRRR